VGFNMGTGEGRRSTKIGERPFFCDVAACSYPRHRSGPSLTSVQGNEARGHIYIYESNHAPKQVK
jgi:hypothetical protein